MKRSVRKSVFGVALGVIALATGLTTGCRKQPQEDVFEDVVTREDYRSVYDAIGEQVTIDMVTEREDGRAFVTVDGVEYKGTSGTSIFQRCINNRHHSL